MLHHPLSQPRTYPHHNHPPRPQPLREPTAFASQLDEIDHLLRAFRLQGQRQGFYPWMPADEDTDERLLDSESNGDSGRRWSDSTESKDARGGGGGGEVSDVVRVEGAACLAREDGADLLGGNFAGGVRDEGLGFGLGLLGSKLPDGNLASAPTEGGLWTERRLVGLAVSSESRLDVEELSQQIVSQGNNGDSFPSAIDGKSNESKSGKGPNVLPGLETAAEKTGLAPVRRVTFILPMVNGEDDGGDGEDTPGRTQKGCSADGLA